MDSRKDHESSSLDGLWLCHCAQCLRHCVGSHPLIEDNLPSGVLRVQLFPRALWKIKRKYKVIKTFQAIIFLSCSLYLVNQFSNVKSKFIKAIGWNISIERFTVVCGSITKTKFVQLQKDCIIIYLKFIGNSLPFLFLSTKISWVKKR